MAEMIGAACTLPVDYKQQLLVFDQVAVYRLDTVREEWAEIPEVTHLAADVDWMVGQGLMVDARDLLREPSRLVDPSFIRSMTDEAMDGFAWGRPGEPVNVSMLSDVLARTVAVWLRRIAGVNAVPLLSTWNAISEEPLTRGEVIQLVIRELPLPSETHSLEEILAYRDHARAEGLIQGLRVWINEMASGKLSEVEVSDKLEDLMSRYERTLKLEKMSRTTGVVETLVVSNAEIAESLVKFRWSKIAKKLFEVKHKQIDLMKAEMTAPGREVAYIVKARERFGNR